MNIFTQLVRGIGITNALLYTLHRLLKKISTTCSLDSYYLVAQPVSAKPLLPPHRGKDTTVRLIKPGDRSLELMQRPADEIERRFAGSGVCFVAESQEQLVGFLWLLLGAYQEPGDQCTFVIDSPNAAWDLDVYVAPERRLSPIFAILWTAANAWMVTHGIAWTLSRVSCFNERSMRSHGRLGMVKLARLTIAQFGPVQITLTSIKPYINLSVRPQPGPAFRLKPPA